MKAGISSILLYGLFLSGCAGSNVVTKEEIEIQNKADVVVSGVLFDNDVDNSASYNIRKSGLVVIKFDDSVPKHTYTEVVNVLRSNSAITGVRAEQGGMEVCPLQ